MATLEQLDSRDLTTARDFLNALPAATVVLMGATGLQPLFTGTWTATQTTGAMSTDRLARLALDISITAVSGTTPTLTPSVQRAGADGVWRTIQTFTAITAVGDYTFDLGIGTANPRILGASCRFVLTIAGTTPSFTGAVSAQGVQV
jgi:hypothetical protein